MFKFNVDEKVIYIFNIKKALKMNPTYPAIDMIDSNVAHGLVIGASIFGIAWGIFNVIQVSVSEP
jgi:hypothetical protein